ncbi:EVE domain-containing protein [Pseudidiomarina woesei]|uniref:Predicted RNA-binding protein, contains PUA-like domain n=1 Tax=Pseudidiomarina woesei TaxID=1381080 RepID=A0A0K6H4F4_9GAMM|nr:EVE domain-containing protein [Pseudidiomarina woesei]CUA85786.1 Predicted RNA-binding protein, contains PUA-like domain [Pseudidiomarina woesei]
MQYWLMKTEPDECSIDDFATKPDQVIRWDGVRNYQARNFMRNMAIGDEVFIYHSSCAKIGIVGVVRVTRTAYPDPTQFDAESPYVDKRSKPDNSRWDAVDLQFVRKFARIISLDELKKLTELTDNPLVQKGNRLSVIPFSKVERDSILAKV